MIQSSFPAGCGHHHVLIKYKYIWYFHLDLLQKFDAQDRIFLIGFTTENWRRIPDISHWIYYRKLTHNIGYFPLDLLSKIVAWDRIFLIGFTTENWRTRPDISLWIYYRIFGRPIRKRPLRLCTKNDANTDVIWHFGWHLPMPHTYIARPMGKRNVWGTTLK